MAHAPAQSAACPEIRAIYASECTQCGLCCVFYGYRSFRMPVSPDGPQPPKKFIQIGPRLVEWANWTRYLRIIPDPVWKGHNRCTALKGTQLRNVECSIYSQRPEGCRTFDPGSPMCLQIRQWGNAPPVTDVFGVS